MKPRTRLSSYAGVVPIPIYTRPAPCGGKCIFCPTASGIPKSYIPNADTISARRSNYSPSAQFRRFTQQMSMAQHSSGFPIEIIVLGGSFSLLSREYRELFIRELLNAMAGTYGDFHDSGIWETSRFRCSVLTVESRPDQITLSECRFLRSIGVSKVEIGVQHLSDEILQYNERGQNHIDVIEATRLLKSEGFKVGYHIMLGLPGSTIDDDLEMVSKSLWLEEYSPDYLKVYPCVLLKPNTLQPKLHKLYEDGKWRPLDESHTLDILEELKKHVPPYVRISRIQRQFESASVAASTSAGIRNRLNGLCRCIRCREVGKIQPNANLSQFRNIETRVLRVGCDTYYEVIGDSDVLMGLARVYSKGQESSVLREIHVYGDACAIGTVGKIQGRGLGTELLNRVEQDLKEVGKKRLLVNAAIGARTFFRKNGFKDSEDGLLAKDL